MIENIDSLTASGFYLLLQEESEKTGKVTSAGMYFLHFQVYRMDSTINAVCKFLSSFLFDIRMCRCVKAFLIVQLAVAKDPESAFFKRLEGLQPCEVSELKAGTHIFAVYGNESLFSFTGLSLRPVSLTGL